MRAAAVFGLLLCLANVAAQSSEILIGSSAALSGPAASLGTRFHAGAGAYFKKINAAGGINGARLRVILKDDGYEPSRAEENTRNLVNDARVVALFGYVGTPTSNAALPLVKRASIPFFGAYTGAESLRQPLSPYVFNVRASYREEAEQHALAMKAAGIRTLNVLFQYDGFGRAGLDAMKEAADRQGITILDVAPVERNSTKVAEAVQRLVEKSPSDAIFMVSTYSSCAAFIKAARAKAYKGNFFTLSFAGLEPLRKALGNKMSDVKITQVVPNPENTSVPIVAEYQQVMRESGETVFDSISLEGYIAARVLVAALRRATPVVSRTAVARGIEELGDLDVKGFKVHFGADRHNGSHFVALHSGK
jgi:ABC-type branched-subunit amino acid transport system substrate-binding protein